jgi:hypothetical protein
VEDLERQRSLCRVGVVIEQSGARDGNRRGK